MTFLADVMTAWATLVWHHPTYTWRFVVAWWRGNLSAKYVNGHIMLIAGTAGNREDEAAMAKAEAAFTEFVDREHDATEVRARWHRMRRK
jgi:hypothetical protein